MPLAASRVDARWGDAWVAGRGGLLPAGILLVFVSAIALVVLHRFRIAPHPHLAIAMSVVAAIALVSTASYSGAQIRGVTEPDVSTIRRIVEQIPLNECKNPAWTQISVVAATPERIELRCRSWPIPDAHRFTVHCRNGRWTGDPVSIETWRRKYVGVEWTGPPCSGLTGRESP